MGAASRGRPRAGRRRTEPEVRLCCLTDRRRIAVGKGWSVFFGAVLFGTFIIWFAAPLFGWWLPENVASFGEGIDNLFYLILALTTFFFVLTEVVQVYTM